MQNQLVRSILFKHYGNVICPLNNNKSHWAISMQSKQLTKKAMKDIKELFVFD
jgi:hypothetical protein